MSKRFAIPESSTEIAVAVFCGGRGASSILRALLRTPGVRTTVLVNAFDDGLSTGRLRGLVPGMLGASDFRKNLAQLLEMSSPVQFAVADLLEYRFPIGSSTLGPVIAAFDAIAHDRPAAHVLPEGLDRLVRALDRDTASIFHAQLAAFGAHAASQAGAFSIDDCALGNLLLAGEYVANGRSFNGAVAQLARALRCRAEILNVTDGENRILVALKADGEILERESRIVGPQSRVPIRGLYLLPEMLSSEKLAALSRLTVETRAAELAAMHRDTLLSAEARAAVEAADVIVYGPGTQHSSLLPSYLTCGLRDAIARGRARHRVLVVNLHDDHDTQGLRPVDLVDRALDTFGDRENTSRVITDILLPTERSRESGFSTSTYLGANVVQDVLESAVIAGVHNGTRVVEDVLRLGAPKEHPALEIYVDLHRRSLAVDALVQELSEMSWSERFAHVTLRINHVALARVPSALALETTTYDGLFSEISMLLRWLREGRSRFLACLTGDGEYRLRDVEMAVDLLLSRRFGVILGARNQSKRQFFGSLRDAYAGKRLMYAASVAGGFGVAAMCGARFGLILSDPLTGFRVYDRLALPEALTRGLLERAPRTTLEVTGRLVDHGVEIAEVPVFYHSYAGFTDERWRLMRGLVNAVSVLR